MKNEMTKQVPADETIFDEATSQILVGLALTSLTLNFAYLDLILPAIGIILMYFGMRTLREANDNFRWGYRVSILQIIFFLLRCWWSATIYSGLDGVAFGLITGGIACIAAGARIGVAIFLCLGVKKACAGQEDKLRTGALRFLIVIFACLLIAYPFSEILSELILPGYILDIFLIIDFIALYGMWKSWTELRIEVEKALVRMEQGLSFFAYSVLLIAGIFICCFAFSRYPMDWTAESADAGEDEYRAEIERLTDLGAPEYMLEDLSAEELDLLKDAVAVQLEEDSEPFAIKGMHMTHLCFCLNEKKTQYAILHYFKWDDDFSLCGSDAIDLDVCCDNGHWNLMGLPTGRVLYDNGETTFTGSYQDYYAGSESQTFSVVSNTDYHIRGGFAFRNGWENRRGYVLYAFSYDDPDYDSDHILEFQDYLCYTHQSGFFQYPYEKALDYDYMGDELSEGFTVKPFKYNTYSFIGFEWDN